MQRSDSSSPASAAPIVSTAGFDGENPLRRFRRLCVTDVLARFMSQTNGENVTVVQVPLSGGLDVGAREQLVPAAADAVECLPDHRLAIVGDRLVLSADDLYRTVLDANGRSGLPEAVVAAQRVAIGGSRGASVRFERVDGDDAIEVFTTRPDTIFGATFLAVSAAHPMARSIEPERLAEFRSACEKAVDDDDAKVGLPLGISVRNPLAPDRTLPVWLANFIVEDYGTGAAGGCPACDQRDLEFARRYGLPVRSIVCPPGEDPATYEVGASAYPGDGTIINSGFLSGMPVAEAKQAAIAHLVETGRGEPAVQYRRPPVVVAEAAAAEDADTRLLGRSWRFTQRFLTAVALAATEQGAEGPRHTLHVTMLEAATRHLLDARILSCALREARGLDHREPWEELILIGEVLGSPEAQPCELETSGGDAARMAMLSDVPPDRDVEWNDRRLAAAARFVEGVEGLLQASTGATEIDATLVAAKAAKASANLDNALRRRRINTALAAAREIVGQAAGETQGAGLDDSARTYIASLLYPLLPSAAARVLGAADSPPATPPAWPYIPDQHHDTGLVELVVQVNGKKRGTVQVARDADEAMVLAAVRADGPLQAHLGDKPLRKAIVVPNQLVNLVL